jgi:capsule polysaccharide export protein KpsE/RkpR
LVAEVLLDEDMSPNLSDEDEAKLQSFSKRECISFTMEFNEGVTAGEVKSFDSIKPSQIKQLILKVI